MTPDNLTAFTIIIACIGIAGWVVATWQWFRANEAEFERNLASIERGFLDQKYRELREAITPLRLKPPRHRDGRFAKR